MSKLVAPHGGRLVDLLNQQRSVDEELYAITLTERQLSDVEMLAIGGFSPLDGFLKAADYDGVVGEMRLADGTVWPIPITLDVAPEVAKSALDYGRVVLKDPEGRVLALMDVDEAFRPNKKREAELVYRTTDDAHPGVRAVYEREDEYLAGRLEVVRPITHGPFERYFLTPAQTRKLFAEKGWKTVVAFQTRNPIHRAHEYLQKCALEIVDGLFVHPIVGATKEDDVPAEVRMRCYEVLLEAYYPTDRVVLCINPSNMFYAGPREAVFHALVRKNYGCSHIIIGRDHAGVGNYYGTYDAQLIFDQFEPGELGIEPLRFEHAFFCNRCKAMATTKSCPHPAADRVTLSGTAVRKMLSEGKPVPEEYLRPEVASVLYDHYARV
ncbi:MAG: sulfate adenylyltransferase [Promethearchaeota archaeon]